MHTETFLRTLLPIAKQTAQGVGNMLCEHPLHSADYGDGSPLAAAVSAMHLLTHCEGILAGSSPLETRQLAEAARFVSAAMFLTMEATGQYPDADTLRAAA